MTGIYSFDILIIFLITKPSFGSLVPCDYNHRGSVHHFKEEYNAEVYLRGRVYGYSYGSA